MLQKNKHAIDSAIISLVRLYADSLNKEYLTNSVYVVNSNEGLGGNLGSKNKRQQWRTAKQQLTNTEHATQKTNLWPRTPELCKETFSTYFVPQPVENTTYSIEPSTRDNQRSLLDYY